jgi:hypothetical protein
MAGEDLTLKAVLEAVLDARGFEEFKTKIEESAANAKRAGAAVEEGGGHFDRLGKRLPNAAFDILSKEMLRNAGIQQGLGPLTRVSTAALESLAAAGQLTGTSLAGITLGLSLLIPLLAMMTSKSGETSDATTQVADDTDTLIATYTSLLDKTGHLTQAQQVYLDVLRELQKQERQAAEDTIQKEIEAQEKLTKTTYSLWNATKLLVTGMIDHQIKGEKFESVEDRMFKASEKSRGEVERLTAKLHALQEAHANGAKSAEEFAQKTLEAGEKAEQEAKKVADAAKRVAEFRTQLAARTEQQLAQSALDRAETVFDREKAIAHQEELLVKEELRQAAAAGASHANLDGIRAASHARMINRISAEEKRYAKERDKEIADGIEKNKQAAQKVLSDLKRESDFKEEEAKKELEREQQLRDAKFQTANASFELLGAMFGKSKATAIAQALMNTYEGATKAIAQGGVAGPGMAAAVVISGLAQVAQIQKQESGFDDPLNDSIVSEAFRGFGRRWASDMTSLAIGGARGGFQEGLRGGGGGNVINQSTTRIDRGTHVQNLTFNGMMGTPNQAMLAFERNRIRIARSENRTRRRGGP